MPYGAYYTEQPDIETAIKQQRAALVKERDAWEAIATQQGRKIVALEARIAQLEAEGADLLKRALMAEFRLAATLPGPRGPDDDADGDERSASDPSVEV
jgi:hypothetical protein